MVKRMPHRKYAYFRDDQIVFLVTHRQAQITSDELEFLKEKVNEQLKELLGETQASITWPSLQIFSFPRATDSELEQLEGILNEMGQQNSEFDPSDYRPQLFTNEQDQSKVGFSIVVGDMIFGDPKQQNEFGPSQLIGLIRTLREKMKNQELFDGLLNIKNISPNWLMGNASQGGTTGGPGGLPTPFKGTDKDGGRRYFLNVENFGDLHGTGENVDVAILDTAPCPHDLVIAPKEWPAHPLITGLLGPNGKLRLYPATYDKLRRMGNTSLNSHDYRMSDHGIFAAGLIHSIVPEATIHLIEVLNPWGVGDLLSLVDGFHTVFHEIYEKAGPERKLVVNCSLMLELPLVEDHCYADTSKVPAEDREPVDNVDDVDFEMDVLQLVAEDQDVVLELNELCKKLFGAGRQVVAAAGNDWENGKARRRRRNQAQRNEPRPNAPAARYPAAFASVVGVGALPKNSRNAQTDIYKASTYSNLGDKPTGDAIMTLGGEEGERKGILGLYLSEKFPERSDPGLKNKIKMVERKLDQNEDNHWAWWAGTSFATPILTGVIAAVLSSPLSPANTQRAIRALYDKTVIRPGKTDAGEDVMEVIQGPLSP